MPQAGFTVLCFCPDFSGVQRTSPLGDYEKAALFFAKPSALERLIRRSNN